LIQHPSPLHSYPHCPPAPMCWVESFTNLFSQPSVTTREDNP